MSKSLKIKEEIALAMNTKTPIVALRSLSKSKSAEVRIAVASNPSTSVSDLLILAIDDNKNVREAVQCNPNSTNEVLFELTRYMFRKLVTLWEIALAEGFEDSNDGGITLDMFVCTQYSILALKRVWQPSNGQIGVISRAIDDFELLLGDSHVSVVAKSKFESRVTEHEMQENGFISRFENGVMHVRSMSERFDYSKYMNIGAKFTSMLSEQIKSEEAMKVFVELAPAIIDLLWQDFALLGFSFYSDNYLDKFDEYFGLFDFEFLECSFLTFNLGTPSWVDVSIDQIDFNPEHTDWKTWGDGFLEQVGHEETILQLYAWGQRLPLFEDKESLSRESGNWYWPDQDFSTEIETEVHILQSDPLWTFSNNYRLIDFCVTPNLNYIEELQKNRGLSFKNLSSEMKSKLVSIATSARNHPEIGAEKVPHYILSLLLEHPDTPEELKTFITLLADVDIELWRDVAVDNQTEVDTNDDDDDDGKKFVDRPREKQFTIVIGRDTSGALTEINLFRLGTEEFLQDFVSIGQAIDFCVDSRAGFDFQEIREGSEQFEATMHMGIFLPGNEIIISDGDHEYWFGTLSDLNEALSELLESDCDWDLTFYDTVELD
jgi:hypothetical protein